ncbi:glycoside hydrolase family 3 C-terminal domain-containing protein [Paenibacillus sp. MMS20-IR301]|uniref:glycoside hydrolase family 3 C-terminal domain-containing protein n=1 Tax=Paenibacillus sp. MMS20-IR301 TaxID=2895946 RepID=UPI0028EA06F8|nr:glycoside hydrolase family 3 C-terminal domain-containing protein [Paenibacillus sp. MMS20-IR301]WNS44195.1 glycoside hydrolase family 3 C-terminal domain-containing protein [Paenibacillus sp. MMS20-IR301]
MVNLVYNQEKIDRYKARAKSLVEQMTLQEKVHQMLHSAPAIPRLGVKAYNWWNEALHGVARAGVATVFPQAIGLAATFDEELLEEVADAIATEARGKFNMQQAYGDTDIYKGLTFWAPNINIFRDPRWGRGHETYGEDPHLTARLGVRFIQGLQGHDEDYLKLAACAKHFAVHSGPEGLRHRFNAVVSVQDLHETYLPAFQACVQEARVEAVMGAYNRTNGEPCCGSSLLLEQILRGEWQFDGHVVSDCWAIRDFHEHHQITANAVESVALAVSRGCDLNCGSLFLFLLDAVKEGLVTEEQIDLAVTRLFTTRMKLGLFDQPEQVAFNSISYNEVDTPRMQALNRKAARSGLVLLKNENGLLPLSKDGLRTIGVIGPNANNRRALVGNYEGTASRYITVLEGIQDYAGEAARVLYSEGCDLYKGGVSGLSTGNDRISEVKAVCAESDIVVVCLGLDAGLEGEEGDTGNQFASGDKPDLRFPGIQEEVLKTAYASGKPVVLVVLSGSALDLSWADGHIPAIMQGWYPGSQGGRAIAEALFGEFSPEGKLPVTFYRSTEELPEFTDYSMKNRTYRYMTSEALYPFGYGLSYTHFALDSIELDTERITSQGVQVTATLRNCGDLAGGETLQLYVKAERDGAPNPQLKVFRKIYLEPGEKMEVMLHLPVAAFALCDEEGVRRIQRGTYTVYIGTSQPDQRSRTLTCRQPAAFTLTAGDELEIK